MTGLLLFRTSASKVASVTALVAPMMITPSVLDLPILRVDELVLVPRQPPLRVDRGRTAAARRGDGLPVYVGDHVSAGEDALDSGPGGPALDLEVTLGVNGELAVEQFAARLVADCDEHAADRKHGLLAGVHVPHPQPGELPLAFHGDDVAVPLELDLRVGERPLLHDLRRAQGVAPVHDRHGLAEPGKEQRLLEGRVAATDHRDVVLAEEEAVTGRTPGHAVPGEFLLARDAEFLVLGPGRD